MGGPDVDGERTERGERMGQTDVERTLGRLLTDAGFRQDFFLSPARACLELGVQLAPHEVEALLRVPRRRLANLSEKLDDRICRLHIKSPGVPVECEADVCRPEAGGIAARPDDRLGGYVADPGAGP
jgi:hypothetical protein